MSFEDIKNETNKISINIKNYSIYGFELNKLIINYRKLLELKERLLEISFIGLDIEELDYVRFLIKENILNIRIMIKEVIKIDFSVEVEELEQMYQQ